MNYNLITDQSEFYFNSKTNRYHFKDTNRFVNGNQFRSLTRKFLRFQRKKIQSLTSDILDNALPHPQWREETLKALKNLAIQSYVLERGGAQRMNAHDQELLSKHLAKQFRYFRNLSAQINQGLLDPKESKRRIDLYIQNVGAADSIAQLRNEAELVSDGAWSFRVRGNILSCPDCERYAARGAMPIHQQIAPGTFCVCGSYCDCTLFIFKDEFTAKESLRTGNRKGGRKVSRRKFTVTVR